MESELKKKAFIMEVFGCTECQQKRIEYFSFVHSEKSQCNGKPTEEKVLVLPVSTIKKWLEEAKKSAISFQTSADSEESFNQEKGKILLCKDLIKELCL